MSVTYNFKIDIVRRGDEDLSSIDIINSLMEANWNLFSEENFVIYTDIGDNDDFNFISKHMNKSEYTKIVEQKQNNKEIIALAMFYHEDSKVYRIDVMITPTFEILISPDDATKKMISSDLRILDVNWYLCRIITYLTNKKMLVESYSFTQY